MIHIQTMEDESLVINDEIILTIIEVREDEVRLRIEHPEGVTVHRQEVYEALQAQARTESETGPRG
jgi:carbon storage regulator